MTLELGVRTIYILIELDDVYFFFEHDVRNSIPHLDTESKANMPS